MTETTETTDTAPTSALVARLRADLKTATRERDQIRLDTIRMALDGFLQEEVARKRQALSEQDRWTILDKQIKQRRESAEIFRNANRLEVAEKEERQAEILAGYLPARMNDDEIRALVTALITAQGKDFRKVMPLASKETKGRADGKRVSEIVRELTA
ncbi:MAG: GatB/YqeY domain-containing protein [Ktedonobacterales bacterium]